MISFMASLVSLLLAVTVATLPLASLAASPSVANDQLEQPQRGEDQAEDPESAALVEWIRSRGGVVDHRQVVRNENPSDPSSLRGIFAKENIPEGTLLLSLPWSEVIVADPTKGDPTDMCGTARALRREMELGSESYYAPYVEILNKQRGRIALPNVWSGGGVALLDRIVGDNGLGPSDSLRHLVWWKHVCEGDPDRDDLGRDAALLQVMRACGVSSRNPTEDGGIEEESRTVMVPYYDMYNHRNGRKWLNTRIDTTLHKDFKVLTSQDVRAGEQLYNSYGEDSVSTLRDYGFVEQLPQLWSFDVPSLGGRVEFEVDEEDDRGTLVVDWRVPPPKNTLFFFELELERLNKVEEKWRHVTTSGSTALPEKEAELAWMYHAALRTALSAALSSVKDIEENSVRREEL